MEWWKDILGKTHKFKTCLPTAVYQKGMFSAFCIVFHVFSLIYQISLVKKSTKIVRQWALYVYTNWGLLLEILVVKVLESHWVLTFLQIARRQQQDLHRVKSYLLWTTALGSDNLLHVCYTATFTNSNENVSESKFFPGANKSLD